MDGEPYSGTGKDNPLFSIVRLRRDLAAQSNVGLVLTDRREGNSYNRVGAADARLVFGGVYQVGLQAGASATGDAGVAAHGEIWEANVDRSGRTWGFRNSIRGISNQFQSRTGFINRTDLVDVNANQRLTFFGRPGVRLEQYMLSLNGSATWDYNGFFDGDFPLETRVSLSNTLTLRGGWGVSLTPTLTTDAFAPKQFATYRVLQPLGPLTDTVAYQVGPRVQGLTLQGRISTPQFSTFGGSINTTYGTDADYFEGARAKRLDVSANLDVRPTPRIRLTGTMLHQEFRRARDNTAILQTNIPRLRAEYQLTRAVFLRFVGQYESRMRDAYRDPRTDVPIVFRASDGTYSASNRTESNRVRVDWLFSFLPSPGRVVYVGYGTSVSEQDPFRFRAMQRASDGVFVKVSYQYRVP